MVDESTPFALLIGGAPGAGKTTLARALGRRLGVDSLSADDLVTAVSSSTSAATHPALHCVRRIGHVDYFTETSADQLEADMTTFIEAAGAIVMRVITARIRDGQSVIIDNWASTPEQVKAAHIEGLQAAWLHVEPAVLEQRERTHSDFFNQSSDPDQMFSTFMHRSIWHQDRVINQARALGQPIVYQPGGRSVDELADEIAALTGLDVTGLSPGD